MNPQSQLPSLPVAKSPAFSRAIQFILPHEDAYARGHWGDPNFVVTENVSGDSGGLTKFGIDASSHPGIDIANLTKPGAEDIYFSLWHLHRLDLLPDRIAIAVFDVLVNGGQPILWLQRAYNHIYPAGSVPRALAEDGYLGPVTISAIASSNQDTILTYFLSERDNRFRLIASGPRAKFLDGWLQRDRDLRTFLNVYTPSTR